MESLLLTGLLLLLFSQTFDNRYVCEFQLNLIYVPFFTGIDGCLFIFIS